MLAARLGLVVWARTLLVGVVLVGPDLVLAAGFVAGPSVFVAVALAEAGRAGRRSLRRCGRVLGSELRRLASFIRVRSNLKR